LPALRDIGQFWNKYIVDNATFGDRFLCPVTDIHGSGIREKSDPFCDQNRIAIDPDWFLIAIMIAIAFLKSVSDCKRKIADRC